MSGPLSEAEYRRRTEALQAHMDAGDMAALLLTTPADVFYVTGFLTRFWESPARPWFVVVPSSGAPVAGLAAKSRVNLSVKTPMSLFTTTPTRRARINS